jgi:Ca-activated chloride channel homolog
MSQEITAPKARLETYVDRTLVPAGHPAQRFALVLLHAPEAGEGAVHPPLNLSLVIDRSGSMSGDKLEFVKDAARHALRLLHSSDRVSIVIYDDEVQVLAPGQAVTATAREDLLRRLRAIHSGGSTDLHGGWDAGCSQVREGQNSDFINRVLLLTDGLANQGITDQEEVVTRVKAQRRAGVSTTTFGVGDDFNQFLLQGMADNGGGHFYFIEKPAQIPAYFKNELGEMLTVTARNLMLEIRLSDGVSLDLLNDLPHEMVGEKYRIELGEAGAGEVRTMAFRLELPPSDLRSELHLRVGLTYIDAVGQPVELEEGLHFLFPSAGACEEQPINEMVLVESGRLLTERAKMQALAHLYRDERSAARGVLQEAIATLQKLLPAELVTLMVRELQHLVLRTEEQPMSAAEAKTAHYSSYRAQRSRNI